MGKAVGAQKSEAIMARLWTIECKGRVLRQKTMETNVGDAQ